MEYYSFALSAVGFALLIFFILKLVTPFVGWDYKYNSDIEQATVYIPKGGRYSINIRRDRFLLWKGQGNISDTFPKVDFSVKLNDTGEIIPFLKRRSLMSSTGVTGITVLIGYFDAPSPGEYFITSLPESRFIQNDKVVVRKHLSFVKFFLLVLGICISSMMFLAGLIFGILLSAGTL